MTLTQGRLSVVDLVSVFPGVQTQGDSNPLNPPLGGRSDRLTPGPGGFSQGKFVRGGGSESSSQIQWVQEKHWSWCKLYFLDSLILSLDSPANHHSNTCKFSQFF